MAPKPAVLSATRSSSLIIVMRLISMMYTKCPLFACVLIFQVEIILEDGHEDEESEDSDSSGDESMDDTDE